MAEEELRRPCTATLTVFNDKSIPLCLFAFSLLPPF
jgi:hypothetical protein